MAHFVGFTSVCLGHFNTVSVCLRHFNTGFNMTVCCTDQKVCWFPILHALLRCDTQQDAKTGKMILDKQISMFNV